MIFKDSDGQVISIQEIVDSLDKKYEYEVYVGSDSQVHLSKKCVIYATCIVVYKKGKGGKAYICKESKPFANSLKERLMNEVWRSLETSLQLSPLLPKNVDIVIHIDANPSVKYKSGNYCQELVSIVMGQGFKVKAKPDAYAAQSVADRCTKNA